MGSGDNSGRDAGRRQGRNTTFEAEAYKSDDLPPIQPSDLIDPEVTGHAMVDEQIDGYHQPTAMFDKGEFLGELAQIVDGAPETRARVEAEEAPPRGCRLIIVAGPDLGMEWAFKTPEIVLGRDEDCDLMMSDIAVSRRHAKLALEGDHFVLHDLGSGNGTYLNGARIEREELSPGDEITVGERTLRFVELNEAPPTAAAHPVPKDLPQEPSVGEPAVDDEGFAPLTGRSSVAVDAAEPAVAVAPDLDGPPPSDVPAPGAALKRFVRIGGVIVLLVALGLGGWLAYDMYQAGETEAMALARAKREFLQGIELVKAKRCGDANVLFRRVLEVRQGYAPAERYLVHCTKELSQWNELEAARLLAQDGQYAEAIEALEKVDPDSVYSSDAQDRKKKYQRVLAERTVMRGRDALERGDFDEADELADRALEQFPGLRSALLLKQEIEEARAGAKPKPRPKKKFTIPPILLRAVALYKNAQISAAIDAAEAAGGDEAREYAQRMKELKTLMTRAREAHRNKAAAELLRIVPQALDLDKRVAGGEGKVRQRLKSYYADGLYLKGIEAYQGGDDVKAFQLLTEAVRAKPGHRLAETRLAELNGKARQIFWDGYVLKDSDPAKTRRIFLRLTKMTRASNEWHKRAKRWLAANPG